MKNSSQANIAVLCIFLFSKTLFASDIRPFNPSTPAKPSSGLPTFGTKPDKFPTTPTTNPRLDPKLDLGSGKKISGTFGSPEGELFKGNVTNAKAACIQAAVDSGERLPIISDSSVWEFATTSSYPPMSVLITPASSALQSKLEGSAIKPAAFKKACGADVQGEACASLLNKSMSEVTQAYYNSDLKTDQSAWDEVLSFLGLNSFADGQDGHMDVVTALKKAEEKENPSTGGVPKLNGVLSATDNQDPLLVATRLIIQRLDESLARGDKEGVERAKSLLKKINPSAAYAASCVLSNAKNGGMNEDLDPAGRPQGSYFGPLSGVDYSKQDELKTHGNIGIISLIATIALGVGAMIQSWAQNDNTNDQAKDTAASNRELAASNRDMALATSMQGFYACKGNSTCEGHFPLAKNYVDNKKKETGKDSATGTSGPEHRVEEGTITMKPIIITAPKPGSGGGGGELVPLEDRPVKTDMSGMLDKQKESWKRVDPKAAENFCDDTVRDFKAFGMKQLTGSGRPVIAAPTGVEAPIPVGAFGVAQFDKWTPSYWAEQKKSYLSDPRNRAKENNCQAMDAAEGL